MALAYDEEAPASAPLIYTAADKATVCCRPFNEAAVTAVRQFKLIFKRFLSPFSWRTPRSLCLSASPFLLSSRLLLLV